MALDIEDMREKQYIRMDVVVSRDDGRGGTGREESKEEMKEASKN